MDSSEVKPTAEQVKEWDADQLLEWIKKNRSKLLNDDQKKTFREKDISGDIFLNHAGDVEFFENKCNLPIGASERLANLARELAGGETAGIKRNRQQAEDVDMSDSAGMKRNRQLAGDMEISDTASTIMLPIRTFDDLMAVAERWNAGMKRNIQQAGDAETFDIAFKKLHIEPDTSQLQELAASARQQRKRVQNKIKELDQSPVSPSEQSDLRPNSVLKLSDPAFGTNLPFPFVGILNPDRFKVDLKPDGKSWFYMGREKFTELLNEFEKIREDSAHRDLMVYGTKGYGKSHLLAALVCYLTARGGKVVYIPDCRDFFEDPVAHMRSAMLFAWADDESEQQNIMALTTQKEIYGFFQRRKDVVFVIDQLNALEREVNDEERTVSRKVEIREWLKSLRSPAQHRAILSSSANNNSIHEGASKQSTGEIMYVYGGFTRNEMDRWWDRQAINVDSDKKLEVEDFTGCIPLLLDKCVVEGVKGKEINLANKFFVLLNSQAMGFEEDIQSRCSKTELKWHYEYMKACIYGLTLPVSSTEHPHLIDHRYFYDEIDPKTGKIVGHYTCGICRNAVTGTLFANKLRFEDTDFMLSLPNFINNPSVTGFMLELSVLQSIAQEGLRFERTLAKSMTMTPFVGDFPSFDTTTNERVLYTPRTFNFRCIDGVVVRIGPKKEGETQKLFMYLLQITLAPNKHSHSRKDFFKEWKTWIKDLKRFDVVPEFVWICPKGAKKKNHEKCSEWPAHTERHVAIRDVNKEIWEEYEELQASLRVRDVAPIIEQEGLGRQEGSGEQEGPEEQTRSGEQEGPEEQTRSGEQEGPEEQTRSDGPSAAAAEGGTIDYARMTNAELRTLLKSRSLPCGKKKKADLVARLQKDDESKKG